MKQMQLNNIELIENLFKSYKLNDRYASVCSDVKGNFSSSS